MWETQEGEHLQWLSSTWLGCFNRPSVCALHTVRLGQKRGQINQIDRDSDRGMRGYVSLSSVPATFWSWFKKMDITVSAWSELLSLKPHLPFLHPLIFKGPLPAAL